MIEKIYSIMAMDSIDSMKKGIEELLKILPEDRKNIHDNLNKAYNSYTKERMLYYLKRVVKDLSEERTNGINDINLNRWKDYSEIITDSLWIFPKRESSGAHLAWYWGNFIPQIPHQLLLRYTKRNEWIIDPFVGSGTTLIECLRLGRNGIGVDINKNVIEKAREIIKKEKNIFNVHIEFLHGDSTTIDFKELAKKKNIDEFNFAILHPPYHDIIKFSNNKNDLSNLSLDDYLMKLGKIAENLRDALEDKRFIALVIGDKYYKGEWIPLGFYAMNEIMKRKFKLKSIVVKNFYQTRSKRNSEELWRYRALLGNYYVFKHEYIFIFKK